MTSAANDSRSPDAVTAQRVTNPLVRKLGLAAVIVMVVLAIYGIRIQYLTAMRVNPTIDQELVQPYARAIMAGELDNAYAQFTSAAFRKNVTLEKYKEAQVTNLAEFGRLKTLSIKPNDAFQSQGNLFSGKSYYYGQLDYKAEKRELWIAWDVVQEQGKFVIDATYAVELESLIPKTF